MPLSATKILIDESELRLQEQVKEKFSFTWFAQQIIKRQAINKDINIGVVGDRGNGKSNWVLKLIKAFITEKKKIDPTFKWSWDLNFSNSRAEALKKIPDAPLGSFHDSDEAGDIIYRSDTMKVRQKQLIKLMVKSRERLLLTVWTTSDYFILDPKIVNMCIFLVAVPYRYRFDCAFAFIYGRNPNPFIYDKFGIDRIRSLFTTKKAPTKSQVPTMALMKVKRGKNIVEIPYPKELFRFLKTIPSFLYLQRFSNVDKKFENQYLKRVKNRALTSHMDTDEFINLAEYQKMEHQYTTLLYNLKIRQGLSYAQLERLHIDPQTGNYLRNKESIKRSMDSVSAVMSHKKDREELSADLEYPGPPDG